MYVTKQGKKTEELEEEENKLLNKDRGSGKEKRW